MATLANVSYQQVKTIAMGLGITVTDSCLWSDTSFVRTLLNHYGIQSLPGEHPFDFWKALPPYTLLAAKWHRKGNQAFWHWVIYWKSPNGPMVMDPKHSLQHNVRTDFGKIKSQWLIPVQAKKLMLE